MTDTNNKEKETFETCSEMIVFNKNKTFENAYKVIVKYSESNDSLNCVFPIGWFNILKQLHDQSLINLKHEMKTFKWKACQHVLAEKDKQIVELESKELNMIIKIKELQAENILIKEALERLLKGKALGTEIDLIKRK